ncbi:NAD-dependent DNA ligase LigA [Jonesiaceae bacterium BS-20]|uniref:DNA ligase n=1 Tax=Jonesiaceae bacterium BS-20 TaxID=3120821 RepID=A0AAU7E0T9_9MICO
MTVTLLNHPSVTNLANQLRAAAASYYHGSTELMTDAEYDAGIAEVEAYVAQNPHQAGEFEDLLHNVAAGQPATGDVSHPVMMGSLDKATTLATVNAFVATIEGPLVLEPKLDGLAIRAVYDNGTLAQVSTRGDGHTGEDITSNALALGFLPRTIPACPGLLEVRGEVYMTRMAFLQANELRAERNEPAFVNQRNAAAGVLRRGDLSFGGLLDFAVYDATGDLLNLDSHYYRAGQLQSLGFTTALSLAPWVQTGRPVIINPNQDQWIAIDTAIHELGEARPTLSYPIDGIVIKADRSADRNALGMTSKAPRWAIAYKYEAEMATTTVVDITTTVGRTGRLAIRVEVEPVFVGGTTITFATGHNVSWMEERDIRVGDTVTIKRANDVIPYIEAVNLADRPADAVKWEAPATDPNGNPWDKTTLLWRSTDPALSVNASLLYAVSRDALDIEGIGAEIVDALVDTGITSFTQLTTMTIDTLSKLTLSEGRILGVKTATKIVDEVNTARTAPWARVITAMGLRATGRTMSRRLAVAFPSLALLGAATVEQLATVEGIAVKKAEIIRTSLDQLHSNGTLGALEQSGFTTSSETVNADELPLQGFTVVVSGAVPGYTRTTVAELIEANGGKSSSSVSANTSLLVSEPSTSSKYVKAQALGVTIVTPADFLGMLV